MATTTVSNAVAERDNSPSGLIEQYRKDFATVLPTHVNPDQWIRLTSGVLRRNTQLAKVARNNPGSFLSAVLDAARLGLEIGDTYHLVPFGNEVVGIADYTGLIELAYRAGEVAAVKVEVVRERDHFRYDLDTMDRPEHRPDWFTDRGQMIGAYAYAVFKSGVVSQVIIRNKAEIEQVRDFARGSKSGDSAWVKWPDRMWKKTVLRELMKFVPTSAEYRLEMARTTEAAQRVAAAPNMPPGVSAPQDDFIDGDFVSVDEPDDTDWPPVPTPGGEQ